MRHATPAARPAAPTQNRWERRKASTRQVLLEAGRRLFSEKGLYESRVEEITGIADIGKGTLYRYFRSKEDLILAVVEDGFRALGDTVAAHTAGAATIEETARGIVAAHLDFFGRNPDLLRIFHQVRGMLKFNRDEWRPFRRSLASHLDALARHLGRARDARRFGPAARRDLALLLFGSVSGSASVRMAVDGAHPGGRLPEETAASLAAMSGAFTRGRATAAARRNGRRLRGGI